MANVKISALAAYTTALDADLVPIVDVAGTATKKITILNLRNSLAFNSRVEAYLVATQTYTTDFTYQKIQFDTERFDGLNEFDNATNFRFTATNAGYYFVHSRIKLIGAAAGQAVGMAIYKNGSRIAQTSTKADALGDYTSSVTDIISLAAADYIEIYVNYSAGAGTITLGGDNVAIGNTALAIHRLS